ncbi:hypothetical protein NQZ68_007308 [Dissostichus eleginoides]|nr:hypothetical protein NQZ68_007308 [Dissostichus eleginoides]
MRRRNNPRGTGNRTQESQALSTPCRGGEEEEEKEEEEEEVIPGPALLLRVSFSGS